MWQQEVVRAMHSVLQTCMVFEQAYWCAGQVHSSIFLEQNCSMYAEHQWLVRLQMAGHFCAVMSLMRQVPCGCRAA